MFEFKQFRIDDGRSGMKVGTDGVLLGAWARVDVGARVWDVGAGSGLISIMAAQRGAGRVVGFELEPDAAADARMNAAGSPWGERIEVVEGDFQLTCEAKADAPDLIVSNPPFFTETLHSPELQRRNSRHECTLTIASIMRIAARRLRPGGGLALIAPASRIDELEFEARVAGLRLARRAMVVTVEGKQPKRFMAEWRKPDPAEPAQRPEYTTIAIRRHDGSLSPEYGYLVQDFYLRM